LLAVSLDKKNTLLIITAISAVFAMVLTSGCFHTGASRDLLFPTEDKIIQYSSRTIAEVRHNFTGAFTETSIPLGSEERQRTIDNFYIGEGGADIYVYAQVHFGPDTQASMEYKRWVHIRLVYEPGSKDERIIAQSMYEAPGDTRYDMADEIATISDAKPGLYSLRAEGVGTAVQNSDVPTYDWYLFTVNGRISEGSYNHNAPDRT
jgi:hypothetical protein